MGTGKTETTKELAKSLGRMCFFFTCSSSLNYDSLVKFFKGFASGGSWACFDELNRIEVGVLSTLATTILTINQAHRERKKGTYLVLRLITQEIELIPTESLVQCKVIGEEIMKGGKLSKFIKGYECIPGLL